MPPRIIANITVKMHTIIVAPISSSLLGHVIFLSSARTSLIKETTLFMAINFPSKINWQARRDSNPQHADLESAALPIGATDPTFLYLTSLCKVCFRNFGQYLFSCSFPNLRFFETWML